MILEFTLKVSDNSTAQFDSFSSVQVVEPGNFDRTKFLDILRIYFQQAVINTQNDGQK